MGISKELDELLRKKPGIELPATSISARAERRVKRGASQKVIDFYIPVEEQKKIIESEKSTVRDIVDVIDNVNRVFYAITGAINKASEGLDESEKKWVKNLPFAAFVVTDTSWKDIGKAAWKGLKREERTFFRDIMRTLAPKELKEVEDKTNFAPFGIDAIEMDALSVPFFIADVLIDPVTYIPFGLPLKLIKRGLSTFGKGGQAVAERVVGKAKVGKIIEAAGNYLDNKIYPHLNIGKVFRHAKKEIRNADGTVSYVTEPVDDLMNTFIAATEAVTIKTVRYARKAATTGEKVGWWNRVRNTFIKKDDSKKLTEVFRQVEDEFYDAYQYSYAKNVGIDVDDYARFTTVDALLEELNLVEKGSKAEGMMIKELNGILAAVKGNTAKAITTQLLEKKGYKRFTNKLALAERNVGLEFAKTRYKMAKAFYKETTAQILKERQAILKGMKSDVMLTSDMLAQDIFGAANSVKLLGDDMAKFFVANAAPELGVKVKSALTLLKNRIENLSKYQIAKTKQMTGKPFASDKPLQTIYKLIRNLEHDVARAQIGIARKVGVETKNLVLGSLKQINRELKAYQYVISNEVKSLGGAVKASKTLQKDIIAKYKTQLAQLDTDFKDITKYFHGQLAGYTIAQRKLIRHAEVMKRKYFKIFSRISTGKMHQKTILELASTRERIFEKMLGDLPTELRQPAKEIRKMLDEQAVKLTAGEKPLLKGVGGLYYPRMVSFDDIDLISKTIPQYRTSRGYLLKRKFGHTKEWKEYLDKLGVKTEDDAVILTASYLRNSELALARHTLQQQLVARLNVKDVSHLPLNIKKSLDYLFKEGRAHQASGVMEWVARAYGKVLNVTKASLTVINPAFWGRNILGYPFFAATAVGFRGFNPANYVDAFLIKLGSKGSITVKGGKKISFDTIREAAEASGYFGSSWTRGQIKTSINWALKRYHLYDPRRWMAEIFGNAMHIEDWGRYGALMATLKSGMDMPQALKAAKSAMFDYNLINSPVDKALQGLFGFYVFCVPTDCEILTKQGWKKYNEIQINDPILSYNVLSDCIEDDKIEDVSVFDFHGNLKSYKMDHRKIKFLFTDNHNWPICNKKKILPTNEIAMGDYIPFVADYEPPQKSVLTVNEAKLLGWILTDGTYRFVGNSIECALYQTEHKFANDIRKLIPCASEYVHPVSKTIKFRVKVKYTNKLKPYLKNKSSLIPLLFKLDRKCLNALYEVVYKADGSVKPNAEPHISNQLSSSPMMSDFIQILCILNGKAAHISPHGLYVKKCRRMKVCKDIMGEEHYEGQVWCPQTKNRTWIMRCNGKMIITGNSRRNLPRQLLAVLEVPKLYATMSKALEHVANREAMTDEELMVLNDFEKENFKIFGEVVDGVREFITLGFTPTEEAYQTLNAIIHPGDLHNRLRVLMGPRVNPVLGTFLDWYYRRDSFYDKEFGHFLPVQYTHVIPRKLYNILGLTPRQRPKYRGGEVVGEETVLYGDVDTIFKICKLPITGRFLNDLANLVRNIDEGKKGRGITRYVSGINVKELDFESRKRFQEMDIQRKLLEKAKERGAGKLTIPYIPKYQKDDPVSRALRIMEQRK